MLSYMETLVTAQVDGPTVTLSTARTSIIPPASVWTLPPNYFDVIGKQIRVVATGRISVPVTTPGSARFDLDFGNPSSSSHISVADSGVMSLNVVAKTNVGWTLDFLATCRAIGTSANLMYQGTWTSEAVIGAALPTVGTNGVFTLPFNTAPVVSANFDTTQAQTVNLFFTQASSAAGTSLTLHQYSLVKCN